MIQIAKLARTYARASDEGDRKHLSMLIAQSLAGDPNLEKIVRQVMRRYQLADGEYARLKRDTSIAFLELTEKHRSIASLFRVAESCALRLHATQEGKEADRAETFESLCERYVNEKCPIGRQPILNSLTIAVYDDPRFNQLVGRVLSRHDLAAHRHPDLKHDSLLAFLKDVLPKLHTPKSAIFALWRTAEICAVRLNRKRYDAELKSSDSLDDPESAAQIEKSMGFVAGEEDRILENIMKDRAAKAIQAVMANPSLSAHVTEVWLPTTDGTVKLTGIDQVKVDGKLPPADVSNKTTPARYSAINAPKEPDKAQLRFLDIHTRTGLSKELMAQILDITTAALRSYENFRVRVPPAVMERMDSWYKETGKQIAAWQISMAKIPMAAVVEDWKKRLGVEKDAELASLLDLNPSSIWRWQQGDGADNARPRPGRLYELECMIADLSQKRIAPKKTKR